jgi:hypothetical protein
MRLQAENKELPTNLYFQEAETLLKVRWNKTPLEKNDGDIFI